MKHSKFKYQPPTKQEIADWELEQAKSLLIRGAFARGWTVEDMRLCYIALGGKEFGTWYNFLSAASEITIEWPVDSPSGCN